MCSARRGYAVDIIKKWKNIEGGMEWKSGHGPLPALYDISTKVMYTHTDITSCIMMAEMPSNASVCVTQHKTTVW